MLMSENEERAGSEYKNERTGLDGKCGTRSFCVCESLVEGGGGVELVNVGCRKFTSLTSAKHLTHCGGLKAAT